MRKIYPRYRNNIFVKAENHLTRTINTFIEYEKVRKIYLNFNFVKNKYELHLEIDTDVLVLPEKAILVYDRELAFKNKINTNSIFNILESIDISEKFKISDINEFKKLVEKYSNKKTNFCNIFTKPEEEIIPLIQSFITIKGDYIHKQNDNKININKMVSKRLYYYVLNRLNYDKEYFKKGVSLKNKIINNKISRKEFVENKIEKIKDKINILFENLNKDYSINQIEGTMPYKDIIICLELFGKYDFKLSELTTLTTTKELLYEKALEESNIDIYNEEIEIINKLNMNIKETLFNELYDYIKIKTFLKNTNKGNFTVSKILTQLNDLVEENEALFIKKGRKRKDGANRLKRIFGNDFRKYYEKIKELNKNRDIIKDENERNDSLMNFIYLIHKMDKIKNNLTVFTENEISKIFNGEYIPEVKLIPLLKKETVLEEIKIEDDYYNLLYLYFGDEDEEGNHYEDEDEVKNRYQIEHLLNNLTDKYNSTPLHPYARNYLKQKEEKAYEEYQNYLEYQDEPSEEEIDDEYMRYYFSQINDWKTISCKSLIFKKDSFKDLIFSRMKEKEQRITLLRLMTW
jgi:hypothetical protein